MNESTVSLHRPDGEWNGKLAMVGVDGAPGRALETEIAALLARGYACVGAGEDVATTHALIGSSRDALATRYDRPVQNVIAFALGRSAGTALDVAQHWPADFDGIVCGATQLLNDDDPDLLAFGRRGGRLIMFHGQDDTVAPAARVTRFLESYERLAGGPVLGAAYVRLFLWPGVDNWLRGPGSGRVDYCELIERWLEWTPRRPPDAPVLQRPKRPDDDASVFAPQKLADAEVEFTRPAYPFPLRAVYKGHGDPSQWRSWYALALYRRTLTPVTPDELPKLLPQDPGRREPLVITPDVGPVVVTGATGRLGLEVVRALRSMNVSVRAAVRDEARARKVLPPGVEVVVADVRDADAVRRAFRGARTLIFTASATAGGDGTNTPETVEYQGVQNCIAAAKAERLAHFVLVSSMCATQDEHMHNLWGEILRWKYRSEAALRSSGVPYTVLRPAGLRPAPGVPPFEPGTRGIRFAQGDRIAFGEEIHRADCALVLAALLGNPDAMGKTLEAWNDDSVPPGAWVGTFAAIARD
jgi:uncharacterized protein YbjT (DUF2867 family)